MARGTFNGAVALVEGVLTDAGHAILPEDVVRDGRNGAILSLAPVDTAPLTYGINRQSFEFTVTLGAAGVRARGVEQERSMTEACLALQEDYREASNADYQFLLNYSVDVFTQEQTVFGNISAVIEYEV